MFSKIATVVGLASAVLAQTVDPQLTARLRVAPSNVERINILRDDQFVFNFLAGTGASTGADGVVTTANSGNFPAVIGNGMAMTYGILGPCGLNIPHTHPRATEINIAVNGTLRTGMLAENGARFVFNNVSAGSVTIFPRGAIHFEMNLECTTTLFIAAFNDEDPGTSAVAQRFLGLPPDIVVASFDDLGVTDIAMIEARLPNNVAYGVQSCLQRCNITKPATQPGSQRQPRVSGNALPSGFSGPPPPPPPANSTNGTAAPRPGNDLAGSFGAVSQDYDPRYNGVVQNSNDFKGFLIALLIINGVFVIGILSAVAFYFIRKRGNRNERSRDPMAPQFAPLRDDKDAEYYDPYHRTPSPMAPAADKH
jgi:oxalate decarboxylase/phosphoglucose isomerase-like protein (cupin superfamily)